MSWLQNITLSCALTTSNDTTCSRLVDANHVCAHWLEGAGCI